MELMDLAFSNKLQMGPDGQYAQQYTPYLGHLDGVGVVFLMFLVGL